MSLEYHPYLSNGPLTDPKSIICVRACLVLKISYVMFPLKSKIKKDRAFWSQRPFFLYPLKLPSRMNAISLSIIIFKWATRRIIQQNKWIEHIKLYILYFKYFLWKGLNKKIEPSKVLEPNFRHFCKFFLKPRFTKKLKKNT